ncbi:vezatin-like [Antedon mediterranea]|uniref:vezatin-like n=1 Tax=Antedon mediterranea TaxID=105859 RepID=UPI003AF45CE3
MEEDDDVVFENSPLHQYLKDVGMVGNFESSSYSKSTRAGKQSKTKSLFLRVLLSLRMCLKNVNSFILPKSPPPYSLNLVTRFSILNSKVLMPGDHQWLLSYGLQEDRKEIKQRKSASKVLIIANSAIFGSIACLWFLLQNSLTNIITSKLIVTAICLTSSTLFGIGHLYSFIITLYYDNKQKLFTKSFTKQLSLMENMDSCIRKSLRNIQEAELIARGFTIVSHKVPLMKLENSSLLGQSQRQFQQLRVAIFKACLCQFLSYRDGTRQLLQQVRLQSEVDNVCNYIANVSIEDLGFKGNLMQLIRSNWSEQDHQELTKASDNFSLSAIKIVWQTMTVQRSEFIRRIGLSLCSKAWDINETNFNDVLPILEKVTKSLLSDTIKNLYDLDRISETHKIGAAKYDNAVFNRSSLDSHSKGQYGEIWTAAHSMYLHLQVAAERIHALQVKCESLNQDRRHSIDCSEDIKDELSSLLETVNPELKASLVCYQEVETEVNRLFTDKEKVPDIPNQSDFLGDSLENPSQEPIQLFGLKDNEIKFDDETFEAYTDPDEKDPDKYSNRHLYQEETEKQRKERQASLQLLVELRSVLPGRMAVREELKQKGRDGKTNNIINSDGDIQNTVENQGMPRYRDVPENREGQGEFCQDKNTVESLEICDPFQKEESKQDVEETDTNLTDDETQQAFTDSYIDSNENSDQSTSLPPPQFGGLWGMASLASQAATMSSNFHQEEEIFGSDSELSG